MGRFPGRCSVVGVTALALLECTHPPVSPHTGESVATQPPGIRPAELRVYVDDAFPLRERNLLEAAAVSLNIQTHGLVTVELRTGLDPGRFWVPPGSWRLLRILGDSSLALRFDMRNATSVPEPVVGICVRAAYDIYIVPDRILSDGQFVSVAMHELLHAVGLEHAAGPGAVMADTLGSRAPVTLSPVDRTELRRALSPAPTP